MIFLPRTIIIAIFLFLHALTLKAGEQLDKHHSKKDLPDHVLFSSTFNSSVDGQSRDADGAVFMTARRSKPVIIDGGVRGKCLKAPPAVSYDAVGNLLAERGAICFYVRLDSLSENARSEIRIFTVSNQELRGYRYTFLDMVWDGNRIKCRLLKHNDRLSVFESNNVGPMEVGRWYFIAVTWDETTGYSVYLDNKEIIQNSAPFITRCYVDQFGLGCYVTPKHSSPRNNGYEMSFDELVVFERKLAADEIKLVSEGSFPARKELVDHRLWNKHRLNVLGWDRDDKVWSGHCSRDTGIYIKKLLTDLTLCDGKFGTLYPSLPKDKSWQKKFAFRDSSTFNTIYAFGDGEIKIQNMKSGKYHDLLSINMSENSYVPLLLDDSVKKNVSPEEHYMLECQYGQIDELDFCLFENKRIKTPSGTSYYLSNAGTEIISDSTKKNINGYYGQHDRNTLINTSDYADKIERCKISPLVANHIVIKSGSGKADLVDKLFLKMVFGKQEKDLRMRVVIRDPVYFIRHIMIADFKLDIDQDNAAMLAFDFPDVLLPEGNDFVVSFYLSKPVELLLGKNGSTVSLSYTDTEKGKNEFNFTNMLHVKELYQLLSEPRPWATAKDKSKIRWLEELDIRSSLAFNHNPTDKESVAYYEYTHLDKQKADFEPPAASNSSIPKWAVYQDYAVQRFRDKIHWWIDNRQKPAGNFADVNDDTCLVQDWPGVILMAGNDEKIHDAFKKLSEYSWKNAIRNGLGHVFRDALHAYEDGINLPPAATFIDYGNPVWIERMMETVRRYDFLTTISENGERHFWSDYYSTDKLGKKNDSGFNAILMQPAIYLTWYMDHPIAKKYLSEWTKSWVDGIDENGRFPGNFDPVSGSVKNYSDFPQGFGLAHAIWAVDAMCGKPYREKMEELLLRAIQKKSVNVFFPPYLIKWRFITGNDSYDNDILNYIHNRKPQPLTKWVYFNELELLGWYINKDFGALEKALSTPASIMGKYFPMFTTAYPKQDRARLPQHVVQRTRLGGVAYHRNYIYPDFAVSWEGDVKKDIAMLVLERGDKVLDVVIYNLATSEKNITMRTWELSHGMYEIFQGVVNTDDFSWKNKDSSTKELCRFSPVSLSIPSHKCLRVRTENRKELDSILRYPDLAVTRDDSIYSDIHRILCVNVHNIGAVIANNIKVVVLSGEKEIYQKIIPALDAPLDLLPKVFSLEIPLYDGKPSKPVTVKVDPDNMIHEINEDNNICILKLD